ncbi:A/G-specific adenine glycosylase [Pyrobaculum sp.]|uniref:A/G-specific adenine glycosylase n=1 Tax=Pyrobaculum sp. TaxID=2004705 RepID=UPI003D0FA4DD
MGGVAEVFVMRIVEWYRAHGDRDLPWRSPRDGWATLVAAVMLRKTTAKQALRVYTEFLERFPTPHALVSAGEDEVKKIIEPLGMEHVRSRLFIELARELVARYGGRVPCDREALMGLPGVGPYIASEVLLVSCGSPEPLLDRNMIRVLERVFGIKSARKRPHTDPEMWKFARSLVPKDPEIAREFNYGVLDLARRVCRAASPKCGVCPLADICRYASRRS